MLENYPNSHVHQSITHSSLRYVNILKCPDVNKCRKKCNIYISDEVQFCFEKKENVIASANLDKTCAS